MREAARAFAFPSKTNLPAVKRARLKAPSSTETQPQVNRENDSEASTKTSTRPTRKRAPSSSCSLPAEKKTKKIKTEEPPPALPSPSASASSLSSLPSLSPPPPSPTTKPPSSSSKKSKAQELQSKKLKTYAQYANESPFPTFPHPTPEECHLALKILSGLHGPRTRPAAVTAPRNHAGCGESPSVLDALVRTILSQNTSDANSTRAKLSMDKVYGRSDHWDAIVTDGESKLVEAIRCGGLAVVKSRVIISILRQVHDKYGVYSLDHLHTASTEDASRELLSFSGVGPKTASCVLLFCLRRESFAVDTHVWRITGLLGWRPPHANREATQAHLELRVPDEDKYGLHILLVNHGKRCDECKAGGKNVGKCELRKAFRKEKTSSSSSSSSSSFLIKDDPEKESLKSLTPDGLEDEEDEK